MKNDIIKINRPDLDELVEKIKKKKVEANEVVAMRQTAGWKAIERVARKFIDQVGKYAIYGGFKNYEEYWKKTADARALNRILTIISDFEKIRASSEDQLRKVIKEKNAI